ncbi:MAG: hypothetical protein KDC44_25365 [Phaeodactylibacter sp.]|nr:hypothetical protein [Phaeodactylibacter sp.]
MAFHLLQKDTDRAREVLHGLVEALINYELPTRAGRLKLVDGRVEGSLVVMTKFRAIDVYRKLKGKLFSLPGDDLVFETLDGMSTLDLDPEPDKAGRQIQYLRKRLTEKYGQEYAQLLDHFLEHPKKLDPIVQILGGSKDEVRKITQTFFRRAKTILLNYAE